MAGSSTELRWLFFASAFALAAGQGCGKTSNTDKSPTGSGASPDASTKGGESSGGKGSGGTGTGGTGTGGTGTGGTGTGGRAGTAGSSSGGSAAEGGRPCIEGALCPCGDEQGTTTCAAGMEACKCPPAGCEETQPGRPCFEPCGGDPTGTWVLEDACMATGRLDGNCAGAFLEGTPRAMQLRVSFGEQGWFATAGDEDWDVRAKVPLSCLNLRGIDECARARVMADPLIVSDRSPLECKGDACGDCDCSARLFNNFFVQGGPWSVSGVTLTMQGRQVPYCVHDDLLWIGGGNTSGSPSASYAFRKKSCRGTPKPCEQRSLEECKTSPACFVGRCRPTTGDPTVCAEHYGSLDACSRDPGCAWDPDVCTAAGDVECNPVTCVVAPGCVWGPPERRCTGDARACEDLEDCDDVPGCSSVLVFCDGPGVTSCATLDAEQCAKTPPCNWNGNVCVGDTGCSEQTEPEICAALPACAGVYSCQGEVGVKCVDLTAEQCTSVAGCSVTW